MPENLWLFDVLDGIVELHCPECGIVSYISEWTDAEVYCEDCGSHSAIVCPECEEVFDHVWADRLKEVKNADN